MALRRTRSFLSFRHSVSTVTTPLDASSSDMYVACRSSRPMTELRRMRSVGALLARSIRTKRVIRLELMSTFAAAVSVQSVSKYASVFTFSLMGDECATDR